MNGFIRSFCFEADRGKSEVTDAKILTVQRSIQSKTLCNRYCYVVDDLEKTV